MGNVRLDFPSDTVSFDPDAFDLACESQGVELEHWRAMRCPIGLSDPYDTRRPHSDHSGCSNGFRYTYGGSLRVLFTGNSHNVRNADLGILDGSTVQITAPRYYDDTGKEVDIVPLDRLFLKEPGILVTHWETASANATGRDKLHFPICEISDIVDATGRQYTEADYTIQGGLLVWTNGGPGFDINLNKGVVFTCRYKYRPFYYCTRIMHEVRVCQVETQLDRVVMRMPISFLITRELAFEKADNDEEAVPNPTDPNSHLRQVKPPPDGPYGAR